MKKLYVTRTAPNPRKALILLASKGIDVDDMDDIDVIDIDFAKEFAIYNPIFADRVVATKGKIELIKDDKIIKTYDEGIFLGVGAGDITYQLRYK